MSAEATGWVYAHSPFRGATFTAHLAIADSVNDQHDNQFFMSVVKLARKSRMDRRTAQRAMRELTETGFLALLERRPDATWLYRFLYPQVPVIYETRGRSVVAPGAVSGAWGGRRDTALTQRRTQSEGTGASHFSPGSGWIEKIKP